MFENIELRVAGLSVSARFDSEDRDALFLPLLREWTARRRLLARRLIVLLAAPPGAGKSVLCAYLEELARKTRGVDAVQTIPLDGFHYPNAYLRAHFTARGGKSVPLSDVKGAPESFDAGALSELLSRADEADLRFPVYDRRLHEPVADACRVCGDILIIEGNYLLLDAPPWRDLPGDVRVWMDAPREDLEERIVQRKMAGGFSEKDARAAAARNDRANILLCREKSRGAEILLLQEEGRYRFTGGGEETARAMGKSAVGKE